MSKEKTLGIAIVTYDQGEFVLPCMIGSLLAQSNGNFKAYIYHDGPSTDGTKEYMEKICGKYPNNFAYFEDSERRNLWGHVGRNVILKICKEPFFTTSNADNFFCKDYVRQVTHAAITYNPDVVTVSGLHSYFNYSVFPGHEFTINKTDFINYVVKTELAKQIMFKENEYAADGHFCLDFRKKFPNFTQHRIDAVLSVHQ